MSFTLVKKLPPPERLMQEIPLQDECYAKIARDRKEIKRILSGEDERLLVIVGPCSAWPSEAVLAYAKRLHALSVELNDAMKIVMRVYVQKPRTLTGWTGPVSQPCPFSPPDNEAGLRYARQMIVDVIEMGLPVAGEAVFTHNHKAFIELFSWVAIGARSAEDQEHRMFASSLDCAVGMKNPTHGSLATAVNSVAAAQHPHICVFDQQEVQTHGNRYAHLVLRGAQGAPNYGREHIEAAAALMAAMNVHHPAALIDASHDNARKNDIKNPRAQEEVIHDVLDSMLHSKQVKRFVKGFMIESFIKEGAQSIDPLNPQTLDRGGLSITDPCLGWEHTQALLQHVAKRMQS